MKKKQKSNLRMLKELESMYVKLTDLHAYATVCPECNNEIFLGLIQDVKIRVYQSIQQLCDEL